MVRYVETSQLRGFSGGCRTCPGGGGLAGNPLTDIIDSATKGATDILDSVTGAKTTRATAQAQVDLARIQAEKAAAQTAARAEASEIAFKALPWVAGALGLVVFAAIVLKR